MERQLTYNEAASMGLHSVSKYPFIYKIWRHRELVAGTLTMGTCEAIKRKWPPANEGDGL